MSIPGASPSPGIGSGRTQALSDGVIAIIMTIMVLELKLPRYESFGALVALWPTFLAYALSFLVVAIMWVNHHHLFAVVRRVNGKLLWSNNLLLFWMSLVPFCTAWLGEYPDSVPPVAVYGADLCACSSSFLILRWVLASSRDSDEIAALHGRQMRKNLVTTGLYAASVPLAFVSPWASFSVFVLVPALYFLPPRRLEAHALDGSEAD
jgi:uncharacterized membrane protein